jgi:hypothetical protein
MERMALKLGQIEPTRKLERELLAAACAYIELLEVSRPITLVEVAGLHEHSQHSRSAHNTHDCVSLCCESSFDL